MLGNPVLLLLTQVAKLVSHALLNVRVAFAEGEPGPEVRDAERRHCGVDEGLGQVKHAMS